METRGLTLDVILEKHGALGETQIWALLYHLALYLKNTLKDAESWTSGPLLSICSTNVIINDDDTVAVKKGSVGEFGKGMFVAPEYYNTETNFKAEKAVESAYVYSTGMMLYSAAEHNTTEEVDLPDDLEDILIGMVNEVAVSRINIDTIIRVCEVRKHNLLSALSELVKELLPDDNVQTEELDSQRTCAETPLTQNKDHPPSSLTNDQSTGDNSRSQAEMVEYANMIPDHADVEHGIAGGSSVPPYPTSQTPHSASQTTPLVGGDSDDGYSNADLLNLNYNKTNYEHDSLSKTTSSNSIENPYGTFNRRKKEDGCEPGQCVHTAEDIDAMYSVISKTRTIEKRENRVNRKVSGTGRVHGYKLDTRLHDESSPKQLTMKTPVNGKPVVVQLPSNKKFQVIVEREDTLEVVFKIVTEKLGLDDTSLFGLMYCPPKGLYEFIPLSHKLRHYAPDKWKSGVQMPPPLALRLAVKYFPPQPYKFVNPMTRLQYFLNLRSLILDGTYQVSKETAFDLVALCLQTDIGDYYDIKDSDDYFQPYNYLPPQVMNDVSHHYVTKEIPMLHSKLDDMSQNEAVIRYLQIVGQLPDYGYHFFEVTERNYYEEKHTWLGVGLQSVNIYERSKVSTIVRGPAKVIPWHKITNLSYKSKSFLMDIVYEGDKRGQRRYVFDTDSTKVSRAIMTLCADTHKFYIKIKNMLPPPHEVPDTFSVRDYTPSPRAIIGNHHVDNSGNPNYAQVRTNGSLYASSDTLNRHQLTRLDELNEFTPDQHTNYLRYNRFYQGGRTEGSARESSEEPDIPRQPDPKYLYLDKLNNDASLSDDEIDIRSPVECYATPCGDQTESESRDQVSGEVPLLKTPVNLNATLRHSYSESEEIEGPSESLGFGLGFGFSPTKPAREKLQIDTEAHNIDNSDTFEGLNSETLAINCHDESAEDLNDIPTEEHEKKDATAENTSMELPDDTVGVTLYEGVLSGHDSDDSTDEDVREIRRKVETMNVRANSRFNINGEKKMKAKKRKSSIFSRLVRSKSLTFDFSSNKDEDESPADALKRAASGEFDQEYRREAERLEAVQKRGILKKERKRRKRLKLLSRGQRLRKKSSSKVSFDDYVTDCEYETDDEDLGWIESPGYAVTRYPSSPDLPRDIDFELDQEIERLNRLAAAADDESSCTGRRSVTTDFAPIPVVFPANGGSTVMYQLSFDDDINWDDRNAERAETPEHFTVYNISANKDHRIRESSESLPLNMEVELGAEMVDTKTDLVTVEVGVQTSVWQRDQNFGDRSIFDSSESTFTGHHLKLESVSKGNKQSLKTIKKKRRLF